MTQMDSHDLADKIELELTSKILPMTKRLLMGRRIDWTREIKTVLGDLGIALRYEVAASGYKGASQGEFLYDMVWYQLDQGFLIDQSMVMEVEYLVAPLNCVDDDFQKLVQARANVRVWITTCANMSDVDRHVANCEKQIQVFRGSHDDDEYVLVFLEWLTNNCVIRRLPSHPQP